MTPLRQRMIEDMRTAGLAPGTQAISIDGVRHLAAHYRRSPDELSEDEVRVYLLGLRERGVALGTFKTNHGGIQLLYRRTLERNWALFGGKKDPSTEAAAAADCPVGSPSPCPSGCPQESDPPDVLRAHVWLWSAHRRGRKPGSRRH
jgi:Phage integrase, N-terminal SAM-like domain